MEALEINNFSFELRKINAIKTCRQPEESKENISEKQPKEKSPTTEIKVVFEQKQDKEKILVHVIYNIPAMAEYELEIYAEFYGLIYLKEPFDIEKEDKHSPIIKKFFPKKILPKISKEIDSILQPIFRNMNVKYDSLVKKSGDDSVKSKDRE